MQYLDKSNTRLKLALQVTNSGMWEWNLLTGQVAWSEHFEWLFGGFSGTSKKNYRNILKRICSEDRRLVKRSLARAIREHASYTIEFRINHPDGNLRWLRSQGEVFCDRKAQPVKIMGLCRDITQEKLEKASQHREKVSRNPTPKKIMADALFRLSEEGVFLDVYSGENVELPMTLAECQGKSLSAVMPAEIARQFQHYLEAALTTRQPQTFEYSLQQWENFDQFEVQLIAANHGEIVALVRNITMEAVERQCVATMEETPTVLAVNSQQSIVTPSPQGGEELDLRSHEPSTTLEPAIEHLRAELAQTMSSPSENGELECISTLAPNLTLTQPAEAARVPYEVKWREAKLSPWESLIQHSSDLITILSADGTILYASPSVARILGFSPDELVGQSASKYIVPQDSPSLKKALDNLLKAGHGVTLPPMVCRFLHQDGSWCVLEATGTNLLADELVGGIVINSRDVTDRYKVQEALRQSEVRFRAIFEGAALGIALCEPSGELLVGNPALHNMFGYDDIELRQRTITHPDDIATDFNLYQQLLASTIPSYQMEKRYFHREGRLVWGRLSVSLVRDKAQNPLFVVCMVEDITAAKQTEAELRRISKAVENASDAISIADTLGTRLTYINPAFCQMFGYTLEHLNACGGFAILFPDPKIVYEVFAIAASGHSWQGEVEMLDRKGARKQISLRTDAIKDVNGEVMGTIAIHTDITERKQAEAELRRSYERALLLRQIANEIRSSLDLQHIFQTTVTQVGQALKANRCLIYFYLEAPKSMLCLAAEYLESGQFSLESVEVPVKGNAYAEQVLASDHAIAANDMDTEPQLEAATQLCRVMNVKSMLTIRTSYQGQPNGVLGLHQCNSYRTWESSEIELLEAVAAQVGIALAQARLLEKEKQTAAQLVQRNRALQLSEARERAKATELEQALLELHRTQSQLVQTEKMSSLGQLVAGVAHEINNPVGFITGNICYACDYIQDLLGVLNLYRQYYPQPAEPIQTEIEEIDLEFLINDLPKLLKSIKVGADRVNQIVRSLRSFSRHDEDEMKSTDIHEGIDNTLMILQNRLKAKGASCEIEVFKDYGTLPLVECYAGQLNQVFMNLISNAIDALEERKCSTPGHLPRCSCYSPRIKIRTEVIDENWVEIRISDNGVGMTEDVRKKLFNPFFTTKPIGKGTGLGLSISYQVVVEKHGGNLQCFSVPGDGTEFVIEIPIQHFHQN